MRPIPTLPILAASCWLCSCAATPTTFVLSQPQRSLRFDTYVVHFAPIADDADMDPGLKESFENGLASGLGSAKTFKAVKADEATERTVELRYRAAGLSGGSLAMRAGTAAANAFLPVGVIPELGGGDLGVETTFLDRHGLVVGKVLVQSEVHGLLSTDSRAMRRIGSQTGEYVASRFATEGTGAAATATVPGRNVVDLSPEQAKAKLAVLEPLIGT
jgi:hypothetical protein